MIAVSHVFNLIKGNTEYDKDKADKTMKELKHLVEATKIAEQNRTFNNNCNENENVAVLRMQELSCL